MAKFEMYSSFLLLGFLFFVVQAKSGNQESSRLFEDLLDDYQILTRPVENASETLRIQVKYKLLQIVDVQEKNQVLRTNGWLIQKWNDYRLKWDPGEYGNITMIHIPAELLFLPDICLYNNADGSPTVLTKTKVDVFHTGDVIWEPPVAYKSVCRIEVQWFPYDIQECDLKFGSWSYGGYEIDTLDSDIVEKIKEGNDTVWQVKMGMDITEYQESIEWDLLGVVGTRHKKRYPCCDYPVIDITYKITIRRKKLFYTINMMIPCISLAILTSFVFYLPPESHNKVTLSISILVALTFFQLLLIELIPPTSLATPLIARYLLFTMIMVTISIIVAVVIQNIHFREEQPMPKLVRFIFIHFLGKYVLIFRNIGNKDFHRKARYKRPPTMTAMKMIETHFEQKRAQSCRSGVRLNSKSNLFRSLTEGAPGRRRSSEASDKEPVSTVEETAKSRLHPAIQRRIENIGKNIRYIERTLKKSRQREELAADWQFVAMTIDRCMLICFSFTIFIGTLIATTSAPSLRDVREPINGRIQSPILAYESYLNN